MEMSTAQEAPEARACLDSAQQIGICPFGYLSKCLVLPPTPCFCINALEFAHRAISIRESEISFPAAGQAAHENRLILQALLLGGRRFMATQG